MSMLALMSLRMVVAPDLMVGPSDIELKPMSDNQRVSRMSKAPEMVDW